MMRCMFRVVYLVAACTAVARRVRRQRLGSPTLTPPPPATATPLTRLDATAPPTNTPTPSPTAEPTATPSPTTRPGADTAPQGTQTGDPQIDAIISAVPGGRRRRSRWAGRTDDDGLHRQDERRRTAATVRGRARLAAGRHGRGSVPAHGLRRRVDLTTRRRRCRGCSMRRHSYSRSFSFDSPVADRHTGHRHFKTMSSC